MYDAGNILKFTPFYFKNGHPAKTKYFVVLKNLENQTILASLPTSKDFIPEDIVIEKGCVDFPEINVNCFVISSKESITDCNKHFPRTTFIYGYQIDLYDWNYLNNHYKIEGVDFEFFGKMKQEIFEDLIHCLKNSSSVKYKHRRIL